MGPPVAFFACRVRLSMSGRSPCAGGSPPALFPHSAPGARPGETPLPSPVAVLAAWVHRPGLAVALLPPDPAGSGAAGRSVFRPGPACPPAWRGVSPCGDAPVSLPEPRTGVFPPSGWIGGGVPGRSGAAGPAQGARRRCFARGAIPGRRLAGLSRDIPALLSEPRTGFLRSSGLVGDIPGGLRGLQACTGARGSAFHPGVHPRPAARRSFPGYPGFALRAAYRRFCGPPGRIGGHPGGLRGLQACTGARGSAFHRGAPLPAAARRSVLGARPGWSLFRPRRLAQAGAPVRAAVPGRPVPAAAGARGLPLPLPAVFAPFFLALYIKGKNFDPSI